MLENLWVTSGIACQRIHVARWKERCTHSVVRYESGNMSTSFLARAACMCWYAVLVLLIKSSRTLCSIVEKNWQYWTRSVVWQFPPLLECVRLTTLFIKMLFGSPLVHFFMFGHLCESRNVLLKIACFLWYASRKRGAKAENSMKTLKTN